MTASYADIIFFAAVAVYLGLKLFSILGKKNDQDTDIESRRAAIAIQDIAAEKQNPQTQPEKNKLENFIFSNEEAKNGIKEIIEKDPNFALETFIEGAKLALEMLLKAYTSFDKKTLQDLLADDVYKSLESQLDSFVRQNVTSTKSLVAIEKVEISSASLAGSRAKIGLKFLTEQINVTKDLNGNIISGNQKSIENVEDLIEFERNIRSSNPNWTITAL